MTRERKIGKHDKCDARCSGECPDPRGHVSALMLSIGLRRKPGRPVTTGSSSTQLIVYRVTAAQRAELDEEARRLGLSSADLAAKARAFPKLGTEMKR